MRTGLVILFSILSIVGFSQRNQEIKYPFQKSFSEAYNQYPNIPRGLLEAVAFTNTRIKHIRNTAESCAGLPKVYGVMGLTLDGKGYFKNNLNYVSELSEISIQDIMDIPELNIEAFGAAFNHLALDSPFKDKAKKYAHVLSKLTELPSNGLQENYALNSYLYAVFSFMNDAANQEAYGFSYHHYNLSELFGKENIKV